MDKKIIALIGNAKRHLYFANEINSAYPLAGIVIEKKYSPANRLLGFLRNTNYNPIRLVEKIINKSALAEIDKRYEKSEIDILLSGNKNISPPNTCPVIYVDDINSKKTVDFIKGLKPDLAVVSGTSLIKKDVIETMPPYTIINMHTGLSPYYRGGPCTFWCLYNEEPEFLGVTIHYLTSGIDSGDIILSRRMTDITPGDNEATLDCKVIRLGTLLMKESIKRFLAGEAKAHPQWLKGRAFHSRDFKPRKRLALERKLKNGLLKKYLRTRSAADHSNIRTVG